MLFERRPLKGTQKACISGPLLDRIDLHVEVPQVQFREISAEHTGETSTQIRARVVGARRRQQERYRDRPNISQRRNAARCCGSCARRRAGDCAPYPQTVAVLFAA